MVMVVPAFLRKLIAARGAGVEPGNSKGAESSETDSSATSGGTCTPYTSAAPVGPPAEGTSARSADSADSVEPAPSVDSVQSVQPTQPDRPRVELLEHGITSNIATVALEDWGYPELEDSGKDGLFSGRYITGLFRSYVTGVDPLEAFIAASRSNLIPKVEESDFAEYIRQVSVLYMMGSDESAGGDRAESVGASGSAGAPSDCHVSKEYYSESYVVADNAVFREDLDRIPATMSSLEGQLAAVNGELQELLERRYVHVHEAFTNVEELYTRFLEVTNQINRLRVDLEGEAALAGGSPRGSPRVAAPIAKAELDCILQSGIERKKSLQSTLGYLQMLRSVAAVPEYIQGVADCSGLAVANMVGGYVIQHLRGDLGMFKLAQSVAHVVGETVCNLERVAETKFVNLALVALLELGAAATIAAGASSLESFVSQLQQPIIALLNASSMQSALETLAHTSKASRAPFRYGAIGGWDELVRSLESEGARVVRFMCLSQVWGCMLLRSMLCAELFKVCDGYTLSAEEAGVLVQKLLLAIQDRISSSSPRNGMATVASISLLIGKTIELPAPCGGRLDYASAFEGASAPSGDFSLFASGGGEGNNGDPASSKETADTKDSPETTYETSFAMHIIAVKRILDTVVVNTFEDFARHLVLPCSFGVDCGPDEIVGYFESFRAFKARYDELLSEAATKDRFASVLWSTLSLELGSTAHESRSMVAEIAKVKNAVEGLEGAAAARFSQLADAALRSMGASCLEPMKLSNIMSMQQALGDEQWSECSVQIYSVEQDALPFSLVPASGVLDERLKLYTMLTDAVPYVRDDAVQDCVQLVSLFLSLLDQEASVLQGLDRDLDDATMRRACLLAETLRYFAHRITDVAGDILGTAAADHGAPAAASAAPATDPVAGAEADADGSSAAPRDFYESAERCSDELESLKQRILHLVSTDISGKLKSQMLLWVLQPPECAYDDSGLREMIRIVQRSLDTIVSVLKDVTDVQMVFEVAFQQLYAGIPRDEIDAHRKDEFRDSCMEIITALSHNACIKLEIFSLADTLSNELFS